MFLFFYNLEEADEGGTVSDYKCIGHLLVISGKICVDPKQHSGMVEMIEAAGVLWIYSRAARRGGPARLGCAVLIAVLAI